MCSQFAIGTVRLFKRFHRPECASGRVSLFAPAHFPLNMRVRAVGLLQVALKAWPVFTQVMPQARQISPALGGTA